MDRSKRGEVPPFIVMDVMEAAAQAEAAGQHIIHMEVGQPGTGAPQSARAALSKAMDAGPLGYTVGLGLPELRRRISKLYGDWFNFDLDPARVVITSGASGAFILAFTALFDAGQRVGLGSPAYPSYRHILSALSVEPVLLPTGPESRFQPRPQDITDLDGLLVASPANPTGSMLDRAELTALADACKATDTALISDEIYHGLCFGREAVTALEVTPDAYVINSFSKYFSMTGWRVGWMVVPEAHVRTVERLAQNMFICAPHASQVAALAAMDCTDELEANVATYRRNRDLVMAALAELGLPSAPPDGAFYAYADVSSLTDDAYAWTKELLKAGVAATPGLDFDPENGHRYVRFSYARSTEDIEEGLRRLKAFIQR